MFTEVFLQPHIFMFVLEMSGTYLQGWKTEKTVNGQVSGQSLTTSIFA